MNVTEFISEMNNNYFKDGTYHTQRNPQTNSTSGNHHVINATYYTIVNKLDKTLLTMDDVANADSYIMRCQERKGIYNRAPDKFDHQSHDDYVGISCTSDILGLWYPNDIVEVGKKKLWYFDNTEESTKFEFKNWHGRFPWATGTYKVCADDKLGPLNVAGICLYLYDDIRNKDLTDTSGKILRFIQKERWKGESKTVDKFIKMWEDSIVKKYSNAMGDVMGIYHGEDHPFCKVLKGII